MRWVQCQSMDCSKWWQLNVDEDYPVAFVCSDIIVDDNPIDCETHSLYHSLIHSITHSVINSITDIGSLADGRNICRDVIEILHLLSVYWSSGISNTERDIGRINRAGLVGCWG